MREKWNFVLYLLWFSYLIISAIIMFGRGFLLVRQSLSDVSQCESLDYFNCKNDSNSDNNICVEIDNVYEILSRPDITDTICVPSKNRLLFILVDALRFDFTDFDPDNDKPLPYQNRLPVMSETLKKWPDRTRLYRFIADPPTTTQQRLKALATGSLPTFVEASSNFAAIEIQEDNIIDQVVKFGGKAVLLGDDTWAKLMPKRWLRSHAMYSFHTWDLDTVDREVDSKIYDEILKDDWTLLVAHYLGVDHAGHRYGPNHPEMTRKLNETNNRLKKIIDMLPPDVLLYVVGDHGMTETGDHGGESMAEKSAAFFAYRGAGLEHTSWFGGKEVKQTDFAPTVAAAMGRPPPAPSLGSVLLPMLPPMTLTTGLLHVTNNLKQIRQYLVRYGEESTQIPQSVVEKFEKSTSSLILKGSKVDCVDGLLDYIDEARALVDEIRDVFREALVEFNSLSMLRSLLLLILTIFCNWIITEGLPVERIPQVFGSTFVPTGYIAMAVSIAICCTCYYLEIIEDIEHAIFFSTGLISGVMTSALVVMHWDGISQRWYEGRSEFFERFARGALTASAFALVSNSFVIEEGAMLSFLTLSVLALMVWHIGTVKGLVLWVSCGVVLAVTRPFRGCREEQGDCWTSSTSSPTQASRVALVLALGSVAGAVAIARRHVGWRGHGVVLAGAFACAHWALGWGTLGSPSRSRLLARGSWLVIGTMFLLLWKKEPGGAVLPISVCCLLLYIGNSLALGAAYAPVASLALLSGFITLNIVSLLRNNGTGKAASTKVSPQLMTSSSVTCLWALLASYQFYATGHHSTLGHIRWAPAFHAGDPHHIGDAGNPVMAALVALDLFGMPLLFGAAVPLLVLWGQNASALGPRSQLSAVFSLCLKFNLCFAIRVFACAISATVHCRHLMVWSVFTPKLLFETGACAAACIGTFIGLTLTAWHLQNPHHNS